MTVTRRLPRRLTSMPLPMPLRPRAGCSPAFLLATACRAVAAWPRQALAPVAAVAMTLAGASEPLSPAPTGVTTTVAGIVSYTRWPTESPTIRLCTLGRGVAVDALLAADGLGAAPRPLAARPAGREADLAGECDVVYVGQLDAAAIRDALKSLAGRQVLLIGEGADFCSDGGMFCLLPGAGAVRFNVNLDAVARSGLRVNPLVLRLGRGTALAGGGS
jgi:hypothetical protein